MVLQRIIFKKYKAIFSFNDYSLKMEGKTFIDSVEELFNASSIVSWTFLLLLALIAVALLAMLVSWIRKQKILKKRKASVESTASRSLSIRMSPSPPPDEVDKPPEFVTVPISNP